MNKKTRLLTAFLFSAFLLSACQDGSAHSDSAAQTSDSSLQTDVSSDSSAETDSSKEETVQEEAPAYLYEVNTATQAIVPLSEDENTKVALLTFDDAPDKYALDIARVLIEKDAPAVFFVNGMFLKSESGAAQLKEIHEMGFEIGNHTQTHASLPSLSEEEQYNEIMETSDLVEEITGTRPRFFRAPFGQNTDYTKQLAKDEGMVLMNWTYGYDWEKEYQDADALTDIMIDNPYLNDGANLLMHDRSWTLEALPAIIDGLREQEYELLDSELIQSPNRKEAQVE